MLLVLMYCIFYNFVFSASVLLENSFSTFKMISKKLNFFNGLLYITAGSYFLLLSLFFYTIYYVLPYINSCFLLSYFKCVGINYLESLHTNSIICILCYICEA